TTIAVTDPTPAGVVSAINAAGTGVTARLVDTGIQGSNYRIMITGATGSQSVFSLSSSPDIGFGDVGNTLQTAQDAILSVNGLSITRSSNEISDAIGGATLALTATTDTAVRLNVSSDKSVMKTNVQAAVAAYNEFNKLLTDLTSSVPNEDLEYSGALAREQSAVRYIKQQVFDKIMGDSSTKSGVVSAMRDIGVSVDKTGSLTFNSDRFDAAALDHYEDVVAMLSANTSNQNLYSAASKGLAQDVATVITNLTNSTGIVATRKNNAEDYREDFADELLALEARMENVYQRYLTQFAAMDSMLEKIDGTKEYLTGQLESLANMYKPQ
ncbi:MAG: flagellar filament capping protein FliD, partial [Porticoccaceae bacterium]|nr:flagellar filament capping protein FliD [Porticoccaceae bacterium]